jgi:hypothetical protein
MIPRFMVAALCVLGPLTCVAHGGNINGEATRNHHNLRSAGGHRDQRDSINDGGAIAGSHQYYVDFGHPVGFIRVP